jgi:hypothetical protein
LPNCHVGGWPLPVPTIAAPSMRPPAGCAPSSYTAPHAFTKLNDTLSWRVEGWVGSGAGEGGVCQPLVLLNKSSPQASHVPSQANFSLDYSPTTLLHPLPQDAHILDIGLHLHPDCCLFAVFDGHGGDATANAAYVVVANLVSSVADRQHGHGAFPHVLREHTVI